MILSRGDENNKKNKTTMNNDKSKTMNNTNKNRLNINTKNNKTSTLKNFKNDDINHDDNILLLTNNEWLTIYKYFETSTSMENLIDYFLFCEIVLNPQELEKYKNEKNNSLKNEKNSMGTTTIRGTGLLRSRSPSAGRISPSKSANSRSGLRPGDLHRNY